MLEKAAKLIQELDSPEILVVSTALEGLAKLCVKVHLDDVKEFLLESLVETRSVSKLAQRIRFVTEFKTKLTFVILLHALVTIAPDATLRTFTVAELVSLLNDFFIGQGSFYVDNTIQFKVAELLTACCRWVEFLKAFATVENFCLVSGRIRFSLPNQEERVLLIRSYCAMYDVAPQNASLSDDWLVVFKCLDRLESNEWLLQTSCKLICKILRTNPEKRLSARNVAQIARLIDRGPSFYAVATETLFEIQLRSSLKREVQYHAERFFTADFILNSNTIPLAPYLILAIMASSENNCAARIVSHVGRALQRIVEETSDVAVWGLGLSLFEKLSNTFPELTTSAIDELSLHYLLYAMEKSAEFAYRGARLLRQITQDSRASNLLLKQRQFHYLLRRISAVGSVNELQTSLEALRVLQSISIMHGADFEANEFLFTAIQSLLCFVVATCPLPDDGSNEGIVYHDILLLSMQLLLQRCESRSQTCFEVMSQLSLVRLRQLVGSNQEDISSTTKQLIQLLADASPDAASELVRYGVMKAALGKTQRVIKTLVQFQRFWRLRCQSQRLSTQRTLMAQLFKEVFLWYTTHVEDERLDYQMILLSWRSETHRLNTAASVRRELEDRSLLERAEVSREEVAALFNFFALFSLEMENLLRAQHENDEYVERSFLVQLGFISIEESQRRSKSAVSQRQEFEALEIRFVARLKAIDRLYEHRKGMAREEEEARQKVVQHYEAESEAFILRRGSLFLLRVEGFERHRIITEATAIRSDLLRNMYDILHHETLNDEVHCRNVIERHAARFHSDVFSLGQELQLLHNEQLARREQKHWEFAVRTKVIHNGVVVMLSVLQTTETRMRSKVERDICREWKGLQLPWLLLSLQAAEEVARSRIFSQRKLFVKQLISARVQLKPVAVELEEIRCRAFIEVERQKMTNDWVWDLKFLRLAHCERFARNAIASQYLTIAKDLILPFNVLRSYQHLELLLLQSIDQRSDILVTEALNRRLIAVEAVTKEQQIKRADIVAAQKADHQRLMKVLLTVTHVLMIDLNAKKFGRGTTFQK